ncbi:MAG: hypothetical protein Q4B28_07320 [bacterium]|nr:hypothetical protein [bacterium]
MKTYKLRNFLSQFFGIWGVASLLGALRTIPFPLTSGKHWAVIGFALLLIGCAIFALNKSQTFQKQS